MNDEKEKYIHVCGKGGMAFALWLQEKLGGNEKCILVDCSDEYFLIKYASRTHLKNLILPSERWVTNFQEFEKVVFYHEQEDWFTDCYSGVSFCFVTMRDDIPYINTIINKLTQNRFCLMERTLVPQLKSGQKIYVLSIYCGCVMSENYLSRFTCSKGIEKDLSYSDIFDKGTKLWVSGKSRAKETNF